MSAAPPTRDDIEQAVQCVRDHAEASRLGAFAYEVLSTQADGHRGELLLTHDHQGIDLKQDYAQAVLVSLERVWRRPVELKTLVEGKPVFLRFDGNEHRVKNDQVNK